MFVIEPSTSINCGSLPSFSKTVGNSAAFSFDRLEVDAALAGFPLRPSESGDPSHGLAYPPNLQGFSFSGNVPPFRCLIYSSGGITRSISRGRGSTAASCLSFSCLYQNYPLTGSLLCRACVLSICTLHLRESTRINLPFFISWHRSFLKPSPFGTLFLFYIASRSRTPGHHAIFSCDRALMEEAFLSLLL